MPITLTINGIPTKVDVDHTTPLLWVLRDHLNLTGTKYSCGIGQCGSCRVLLDNQAVNACRIKISEVAGKEITTIEGLAQRESQHPLFLAWTDLQVPQCGYCQSGQLISAYALLQTHSSPTDEQIDQAMSDVLCRCGTYPRIRKAVKQASRQIRKESTPS
jgi:isoquinoline 1-oxidoreductase alpha subunit